MTKIFFISFIFILGSCSTNQKAHNSASEMKFKLVKVGSVKKNSSLLRSIARDESTVADSNDFGQAGSNSDLNGVWLLDRFICPANSEISHNLQSYLEGNERNFIKFKVVDGSMTMETPTEKCLFQYNLNSTFATNTITFIIKDRTITCDGESPKHSEFDGGDTSTVVLSIQTGTDGDLELAQTQPDFCVENGSRKLTLPAQIIYKRN